MASHTAEQRRWRRLLTPHNARVLLIAYVVALIVFAVWVLFDTIYERPPSTDDEPIIDVELGAYLVLQLGTVAAGGIQPGGLDIDGYVAQPVALPFPPPKESIAARAS